MNSFCRVLSFLLLLFWATSGAPKRKQSLRDLLEDWGTSDVGEASEVKAVSALSDERIKAKRGVREGDVVDQPQGGIRMQLEEVEGSRSSSSKRARMDDAIKGDSARKGDSAKDFLTGDSAMKGDSARKGDSAIDFLKGDSARKPSASKGDSAIKGDSGRMGVREVLAPCDKGLQCDKEQGALVKQLKADWAKGKLDARRVQVMASKASAQGTPGMHQLDNLGAGGERPQHIHAQLMRLFGSPRGAPPIDWITIPTKRGKVFISLPPSVRCFSEAPRGPPWSC